MRIPAFITAGDSATWIDYAFNNALGDSIDATAYTLAYSFRGPLPTGLDLTGSVTGTAWTFTLTTAQSAALNAGAASAVWFWQAYATKAGVRLTAGEGQLVVRPNLAGISAVTFDGRSQAEQVLSTVEAAIAARVNGDFTIEYTIGTRSLKREPMANLIQLRDKYRFIVSRQRKAQMIANGLGNPTRLGVRFKA